MYPRKRVGLERALSQLMYPKNFYIPKKLIHIAIILHPKENEHKNTILQRCVHKFTMSSGRADDFGEGLEARAGGQPAGTGNDNARRATRPRGGRVNPNRVESIRSGWKAGRKFATRPDPRVQIRLGTNAFEFDVRVRKVRGFCSSSSEFESNEMFEFEFEVRVFSTFFNAF